MVRLELARARFSFLARTRARVVFPSLSLDIPLPSTPSHTRGISPIADVCTKKKITLGRNTIACLELEEAGAWGLPPVIRGGGYLSYEEEDTCHMKSKTRDTRALVENTKVSFDEQTNSYT